jgi:hypothetical protein
MRTLQVMRAGLVVLAGAFVTLNGGDRFTVQAQQPSGPVRLSNDNPPMGRINQPETGPQEKGVEEQKVRTPAASERQKKLAADTERLLALAKELKQEVDKTNKNVLSVGVVKKAEEIEKLARSVRSQMKE